MRRIGLRIVTFLPCVVVLLISSCGESPTPAEVAQTFYVALYNTGDTEAIRQCSTESLLRKAKSEYGSVESWVAFMRRTKLEEGFSLVKVEVLREDPNEDGDKTRLSLRLHDAEGNNIDDIHADLVKERGKWKVAFE